MCKRRLQIIFNLLSQAINSSSKLQCKINAQYGWSTMENASLVKQEFSWDHALFDKIFFCPGVEFIKGKHSDRGKSPAYLDILCTAARTSKLVHISTFSSVGQEWHIRIYTITGAGYSQKSVSFFFFHCLNKPA